MKGRRRDIAVVGMACRFPGGVSSPDAFWRLLREGRDAVGEIPADRWDQRLFGHPEPAEPGKSYTFRAGHLGDVSGFDAAFFGISPREAAQMDPQQRLLLEMTWEALERGGQVPEHVAGSDCAVYVGISGKDYADRRLGDSESADAYFMLGSTLSIAANRISYIFDLRGPSMAVDTACSSALVALHEAVHAVQDGRASMAVVGGISLLLSPFPFAGFSKASMLAPYGQCRAFDRMAKGYVRAEGGGVLVLKPLDRALRDRDPIHGVIRGIGINSDGKTQGIALPSAAAQETLLRRVYDDAGIAPEAVSYIEAHGTGTAVGDPAEAGALGRALGQRRKTALPIGSVKTNIGHLEPAAGMAGVVKALLILKHRQIPPSLHCDEPNPDIDFAGLNVAVVRRQTPLGRGKAIVGVNSFGFGGTNAHVVLEEYRRRAPRRPALPEPPPLFLSARCEPALKALAAAMAERLSAPDAPPLYDIAWTAALRRGRHNRRLVARAADAAGLAAGLAAYAGGRATSVVEADAAIARAATVGLVFSGNGAQWQGMGQALFAQDPWFRQAVERVDALVKAECGLSLIDEMHAAAADSRLDDTRIAQPLLFACQVGMVASLRARGLVAAAVAGHSVGEVAAAHVAGALTLGQAVQVIVRRSGAQAHNKGLGRMAVAALAAERAAEIIDALGSDVEVAAINAPAAVTLSGTLAALTELGATLAAEGVDFRLLDLDYAFHSRLLDPVRDELLAALDGLAPCPGTVRFFSTVSGGELAAERLDAVYWWENVRRPVRFSDAVAAMAEAGIDLFVEVGPHPIMQGYLRETLAAAGSPGRPLSVVNRRNAGAERLRRAVDQIHLLGGALDWSRLFPVAGACVELPDYPWQRERYWVAPTPEARGPIFQHVEQPLLGVRVDPGLPVWQAQLDAALFPFLADHVVGGSVLFPAAGFVEMALEASRQIFETDAHDVEMLEIRRPLLLEPKRPKMVRFLFEPEDGVFHIESRTRMTTEAWSRHASGRLSKAVPAAERYDPVSIDPAARRYDAAAHYAFADAIGLAYGPKFRSVAEVAVAGDTALARLTMPEGLELADALQLHPSLLDGCLQALFDILRERGDDRRPVAFLPYRVGRLLHHGHGRRPTLCRVTLTRAVARSLVADFVLMDDDGLVLAELRDFRFRRMELKRRRDPARLAFHAVPLDTADRQPPDLLAQVRAVLAAATATAPDFTALAGAFAARALADIAFGSTVSAGVVPDDRRPLLDVVAAIAVEAGLAMAEDGGWRLTPSPPAADAAWREALARHPAAMAELTMLGRVGRDLPEILAGTSLPPLAGPALLDHLLDASPRLEPANAALAAAVAAAIAAWPPHRRLRVVELDGGAGLTARLLPLLPAGACDYTLAVADADAQARAEGAYGQRVRVVVLDLLAQPDEDARGRHDLVVGAHALHACGVPRTALETIGALAADGALVLLAEPRPAPWFDLAAELSAGRLPHGTTAPWTAAALAEAADAAGLADSRAVDIAGGLVVSATAPHRASALPPALAPAGESWLILADEFGAGAALADALAAELAAAGGRATRVVPGTDYARHGDTVALAVGSRASWSRLWQDLADEGVAIGRLVHLLGIGESGEGAAAAMATQDRRCWSTLALVQSLADVAAPAVALVTHRALDLPEFGGDRRTVPAQAPLWGVGRVLQNEHPELRCRLIDLRPEAEPLPALAAALAAELGRDEAEDEVVLGGDRRFGLRLRREPAAVPAGAEGQALTFVPGSLDSLAWAPLARRAPGAGEVEIAVRAAGLNFRDVMFAMGVLPDEAVEDGFAGATIGMEAAGVISRVGPDVVGLRAGDEVMCFAPACFATHVTTAVTAVAPKPAGAGFAAAATVPTVFFTVYYALHHLARLEAGERILIHGAAGGVGMAAIQYARHVGAEIYATAGSDEKRDVVRLLGVPGDHVLDSRSLAFADQVMALTGGEGVDVVLNSLAGEAIHKSLGTLRPFGRFLELGKRDFYANSRLGLRPFRNNISYFGIDADQIMAERPALAGRLFREMAELFRHGAFHPLPYRVFPRERAVDAFRHMQQARHMGKIVLAVEAPPAAAPAAAPAIDGEALYLVSGGLSGFGLETAKWLAARGARHLALLGRRGAVGAEAGIAALTALGADVRAFACDVADAERLAAVVADLAAGGRPIRGVVHAAAVFEDGVAASMTRAQFAAVLTPKVAGGWNLHAATLGQPLDFFVVYSSVTTLFGNPGQANYVAANLYLESLMALRRAQGLPGLAVCWGAIGDAGFLLRNAEVRGALEERMGVGALAAAEALDHLGELLAAGATGVAVADIDWRLLRAGLPAMRSPKLADLAGAGADGGGGGDDGFDILARIADLSPDEVRDLLVDVVSEQVGQVLRVPAEKLDVRQSIFDMGMDSLMALELRMRIEEKFGVELPAVAITEGASIVVLAERVRDHLIGGAAAESETTTQHLLARHELDGVDDQAVRAVLDRVEEEAGEVRLIE